ncbi:MAG TPA: hypothetical protein VM077_04365 [Candidatus Limnocylindrales bacterium]|nr:hypothetical protein [Candidatus Limnocylindrales bacterium]
MQTNRLVFFVAILFLLAGGVIFAGNRKSSNVQNPAKSTPSISTVQQENSDTQSPSGESQELTPDAKHSGEGIIDYANVEQGSGAQLVGITGVGNFAINITTKIYDENNKETAFSYLRKGQKVHVSGAPGEGNLQALEIRVQK